MPAEIVTMTDCASNYAVYHVPGSRGKTWVVSLGGSEGPAHCTCPAFKFSGERHDCKHIRQVWAEACLYNPQWRDGPASGKVTMRPVTIDLHHKAQGQRCPTCGGPMVYVRRAV